MIEKHRELAIFLYRHSLVRYLLVGGTTFSIDFSVLVLLHGVLNINVIVAASMSYWLSIAFNFVMNRYWTFSSKELINLHKHLLLYGLLLGFNYIFTVVFISLTTDVGLHYTLAKIIAVPIQMSWTYFAYKKIFEN